MASSSFVHSSSHGSLYGLVRDGVATNRSEIARLTGLSPSTVASRIDELVEHGFLIEAGSGPSRGGRKPRTLAVAHTGGTVFGVELGARVANIGFFDLGLTPLRTLDIDIDITDGPSVVLDTVVDALLAHSTDLPPTVAMALAVPGPVGEPDAAVISPSRMPGWNMVRPHALLESRLHVPITVENDANALALGELVASDGSSQDMVVIKAGSGIGAGVITEGSLYRGFRGVAGDISHVPVEGGEAVVCSCGRVGCLDALASGAALARVLAAAGEDVADVNGVLRLARDGHPLATKLLRQAGERVGTVVATIINFYNPHRLLVAGSMSTSSVFMSGLRSAIYDRCLPMMTEGLDVQVGTAGRFGGARGAAFSALSALRSPLSINTALESLLQK